MLKMFVSYKDEDEKIISGYFDVINLNEDGFLVFNTSKNKVRIPLDRVLKIKEDISNEEEE